MHGNLQQGGEQGGPQGDLQGDGGQGLHLGGGHGLHGRHGFEQQDDLQHFLHGTERHGIGPHGFLHPFLQHLGLQGDGRHTIILHFGGRHGPGGEHGIGQGEPQGGGLDGGGVHSNISSFLASGAPLILRITNSKTPRRGFVTVDTFTGACSSPDDATIHFGPWQGSLPCTGHGSLGPIRICETVATISPFVPPCAAGQAPLSCLSSLIDTAFPVLVPAEDPRAFLVWAAAELL